MSGVNKVILVGRLGKDPEVKYTEGGLPVCSLSLATSEVWKDREGQKHERTEWHRVVVFGKQAEICSKSLAKGSQAYIEGGIRTKSWEDDQNIKRYTTEVFAKDIQFLSPKPKEKNATQSNTEKLDLPNHAENIPF